MRGAGFEEGREERQKNHKETNGTVLTLPTEKKEP